MPDSPCLPTDIGVPYSKIVNISYNENFWTGSILKIETNSEKKKLLTLNALSKKQKREKRKLNKKMQKEIVARKKAAQAQEPELKSSK